MIFAAGSRIAVTPLHSIESRCNISIRGAALLNNLRCRQCELSQIKHNGYTHYGKQSYRCKDCDRQFVEDSQDIGEGLKDLIKVLLLERLS